jgi:hypothetical protein
LHDSSDTQFRRLRGSRYAELACKACNTPAHRHYGLGRKSWTITEDEAMSVKGDDLDAGRVDFSEVATGKRLPPGDDGRELLQMHVV